MNLTFRGQIEFGSPEFADEVYGVVAAGTATDRFQMAEKVAKTISQELFQSSVASWPIYNLAWVGTKAD